MAMANVTSGTTITTATDNDESELIMAIRKDLVDRVGYVELSHWCTIEYCEFNHHFKDKYHATKSHVVVNGYTPPLTNVDWFCLGVIFHFDRNLKVEQARQCIRNGVDLKYIGEEVFAENLSDGSLFVQSSICNYANQLEPYSVREIPTGLSLKIFDHQVYYRQFAMRIYQGYEAILELQRMCTIFISFMKGWGPGYDCQNVKDIPCWIVVHLDGPLLWLEKVLSQMKPNIVPYFYS